MKSTNMTCTRALTTLVDDADTSPSDEVLRARLHASRCPRCSSAYDRSDLGTEALAGLSEQRAETTASLRAGLAAIAGIQLVFAVPWLFGKSLLPDAHIAVSHLTRDGALGFVIAALGIITAWRPRYAHSTMLMGLVVFGLQLITGLADHQSGAVSAPFEAIHTLLVIIVFGLFAVAADAARRATPSIEPKPRVLHSRTSPP